VLKKAEEQLAEKYRLQASAMSIEALIEKVAHYYRIDPENLKSASKESTITKARRVLCYLSIRKLGFKCSDVSRTAGIRPVTVSKAVSLGSKLPEIGKIQKHILGQ
jgi:chromosomal replication initiation ATPase DnaA